MNYEQQVIPNSNTPEILSRLDAALAAANLAPKSVAEPIATQPVAEPIAANDAPSKVAASVASQKWAPG